MRQNRWAALLIVALVVGGTTLASYALIGASWPNGSIVMQLQLGSSGTLLDGSASWNASAENALAAWNQYLSRSSFRVVRDSTAPTGSPNGYDNVFFADDVYGSPFGSSALAVTAWWYRGNTMIEADVMVNRAYTWNSYRGPLRSSVRDLHRVVLHEFTWSSEGGAGALRVRRAGCGWSRSTAAPSRWRGTRQQAIRRRMWWRPERGQVRPTWRTAISAARRPRLWPTESAGASTTFAFERRMPAALAQPRTKSSLPFLDSRQLGDRRRDGTLTRGLSKPLRAACARVAGPRPVLSRRIHSEQRLLSTPRGGLAIRKTATWPI